MADHQKWKLNDNIDYIEAQFVIGDFCINKFPDNKFLTRAVQTANTVQELRSAISPVVELILNGRQDLSDELTFIVLQLNKTKL